MQWRKRYRMLMLLLAASILVYVQLNTLDTNRLVKNDVVNDSLSPVLNREVFNKAQACLLDSPFAPPDNPVVLSNSTYQLPIDIEAHYKEMLEVTFPLRNLQWSSYAGYHGPWMENVFIESFCCNKPLSFFGGLVPLFIQWTDLSYFHGENWFKEMGSDFLNKMRKDVIYVTVSQHDNGINLLGKHFNPKQYWNILSLSAGGYGHAPLPLFIKPQPLLEFNKRAPNLFVFAGHLHKFPTRHHMKAVLENRSKGEPFFSWYIYSGPKWIDCMRSGVLNLAPRGYGRSSFRTTEAIQMGLIPVYLYSDDEWVPYRGSEADLRNFGFSMHYLEFDAFVQATAKGVMSDPDYLKLDRRIEIIKRVRETHYSFAGLMQQIQFFVQNDPRSNIRCQRHPSTNHISKR